MRRSSFIPLLIAALACRSDMAGPPPGGPDVDVGVAGDGQLDVVLESIRGARGLPALAAIMVHDGAVVESGAVGLRAVGHEEAVTTDDLWHLGSLTKAMTGTLAGVLVESGVIDWSTTVMDVFPDFAGDILNGYQDLRLDELLYHTAGLGEAVTQVPSWPDIVEGNGTLPELRRQWALELLQIGPGGDRGAHLYTNAGYVVAGAMLEEVTGDTWEDLMVREVLAPLGMDAAGFGAPGTAGVADQPWGHVRAATELVPFDPGNVIADNPAALGPAGTVHASLDAYARYMIAHLAGARGEDGIVSASTFLKLQTPAAHTPYALGWGVLERDWADGAVLTHNGSNQRWYATVWLAPQRNLAFLAVTNVGGDLAFVAVDEAVQAMILRFDAAEAQ